MIKAINHITYSVSDLRNSIKFYKDILKATLLVEGKHTAYFTLEGVWLALNEEKNISRNEIKQSYTHIAFSISESDFDSWYYWLKCNQVNILKGRE
ncbi:VOC family protein, partial [Staphylococcus pseudintermedius]